MVSTADTVDGVCGIRDRRGLFIRDRRVKWNPGAAGARNGLVVCVMIGAPDRTRTCGLRIRSPSLYPPELQARKAFLTSELVGARGFEPPTPCTQSRCASRTALRPDRTYCIPIIWTRSKGCQGAPSPDPLTTNGRRPRAPPETEALKRTGTSGLSRAGSGACRT